MEITHLLKKLKKTTPEEIEQFLAIQIDTEFVKTAVWTVRQHKTEITVQGGISEWDGASTEVLLEAIDNSLTPALEKLGDHPEPDQAIFGLPEAWVTPEGIAAARLGDLKVICEKLALKPLGFVVTTEAITHYLRSTEGTPLTGILLRASTSEVAVSIVNLGHIEGTHIAGRSGDLASDVMEGLVRFGQRESLPSRMILYNGGEDLQDLTQQLLAYDWQSTLPFLHLPKIEAASDSFSITAIAVAGGTEVAKSLGFTIAEVSHDRLLTDSKPPLPTDVREPVLTAEESEEKPLDIEPGNEPPAPTEPGDSKDEETEAVVSPAPEIEEPKHQRWSPPRLSLQAIREKMRIPPRLSWQPPLRFRLPVRGLALTGILTATLLTLSAVGVVQAARRLPRAAIRLTFSGQTLSQRLAMTVDPDAQTVDAEKRLLPAEKVTVSLSGEQAKETTGEKTIGDKAKGEVTIFNKTNATKNFPGGITITAPNGKQFILDSEIFLASQSAQETDTGMNIIFGTATAKVTASDIGPESNLETGNEFRVSNLSPSAFSAKNQTSFSGGTKSETQVVSKKDQADLREALVAQLKSEAAEKIKLQAGEKRIFPETIIITPREEQFSAQAGEEAKSITLKMTADATALAIEETNYRDLLSASLQGSIPDGLTVVSDRMDTRVENVETTGNTVSFDAIVSVPLIPRLNQSDILARIGGKRPAAAADSVKDLPHFKRAEMSFSPALPAILQWVPVTRNHISLEIAVEE